MKTFLAQPLGSSSSGDLSVFAMLAADDAVSMLGANPRKRHAIDHYTWGRAALHFAGISLVEHERLARKLGSRAAAEVLLLAIAQQCGTSLHNWQLAKDLGIPWQEKRWTTLTTLMREYNEAVIQVQHLEPIAKDAALSVSFPGDSPAGDADPRETCVRWRASRRDVPPAESEKRWTSLSTVMRENNEAVTQVQDLELIAEDAALWESSPGGSPAGDAHPRETCVRWEVCCRAMPPPGLSADPDPEQADSSRRDVPPASRSEPPLHLPAVFQGLGCCPLRRILDAALSGSSSMLPSRDHPGCCPLGRSLLTRLM